MTNRKLNSSPNGLRVLNLLKKSLLVIAFQAGVIPGLKAQSDAFLADSLVWDSLSLRMEASFNAGQYLEASQWAGQANSWAAAHFPPSHPLIGLSLDNLGTTLHHAGKLQEARPVLEAGLQHGATYLGTSHEDYLTRLNNLAMLYKDLKEYGLAMAAFEELLENSANVFGRDDPTYGIFLNNAGVLCEQTGRLEQAAGYYREALDITARSLGKQHPKYANRLYNLAVLYRKNGQYAEALSLLEEATLINEGNDGKSQPGYIACIGETGLVYKELKQYDLAEKYLSEALDRTAGTLGKNHVLYATYLHSMAGLLSVTGRHEQAIALWLEMTALQENVYGPYPPQSWVEHRSLAVEYGLMGEPELCALHLRRASGISAEFIRRQFGQMGELEQAGLVQEMDFLFNTIVQLAWQYPENEALTGIAYDHLLVSKNLLLDHRRKLLQSLRNNPDPELHREFADWETLQSVLAAQYSKPAARRRVDFDSLQQRSALLENRLARHSESFREARLEVHWEQVQAALQPGEAALEMGGFSVGDTLHLIGFLLKKNAAHPELIDFGAESSYPKTTALRRAYGFSAQATDNLQWLAGKRLEPQLAGLKRLYLSPYGLFHLINLGALPLSEDQTLSDRLQIVQLGSTREIVTTQTLASPTLRQPAFIFGGIDYDSPPVALPGSQFPEIQENTTQILPILSSIRFRGEWPGEAWQYLPATQTEARDVESLFRSRGIEAVRLSDSTATEEAFKALGKSGASPFVVHLATHGFFFPSSGQNAAAGFGEAQNPLIRSGLVLAGANRVWLGGDPLPGRDDGILTAYEIAQMDLSQTELVVLSAYGTGLGDLSENEGVYGLQRAFRIAGAHYVLMTLWSVEDHFTQMFMHEFYQNWLVKGASIPEAYQNAQNYLRSQAPKQPALWAAFVLIR